MAKFRGGGKTKAYQAIVDLFFSLVDVNQVHFHSIIAEFGKFSHGAFEGGRFGIKRKSDVFPTPWSIEFVATTQRNAGFLSIRIRATTADLLRFHGHINVAAQKRYRVEQRLVLIEQTDSRQCNLTQMVDIIIGGVAHLCNAEGDEGHKSPKRLLTEYILKMSKHSAWE